MGSTPRAAPRLQECSRLAGIWLAELGLGCLLPKPLNILVISCNFRSSNFHGSSGLRWHGSAMGCSISSRHIGGADFFQEIRFLSLELGI